MKIRQAPKFKFHHSFVENSGYKDLKRKSLDPFLVLRDNFFTTGEMRRCLSGVRKNRDTETQLNGVDLLHPRIPSRRITETTLNFFAMNNSMVILIISRNRTANSLLLLFDFKQICKLYIYMYMY